MVRTMFFLALALSSGAALSQTPVKTKVFPGAQALPLIVATSQGIFERHGLKVELLFTQNSVELRDGLATGAFVLRDWAKANAETLERYIAALIEATRWAVAPQNKAVAAGLLVARFKLWPQVAERTWDLLADPKFGLAPDARFNPEGFRNVLALRAEMEGEWGGKPPASERYVDLSYYEKAIRRVGTRAP